MKTDDYRWTITAEDGAWVWRIIDPETDRLLVEGAASTRPVAAAMAARSVAAGMTFGEARPLVA